MCKDSRFLEEVGLKPEDGRRGLMDVVGYPTTAAQMDAVLAQSSALAEPRSGELDYRHGWGHDTRFLAGICPHDDYYYAARLYALLLSRVRAKRVVLFGVFHKARLFDCGPRLVFDTFNQWFGPYGPVNVPELREGIIDRLPPQAYVVDDDAQMVEHSVEGIVSFLQAYNRDVEIVSILVPAMNWETIDDVAHHLAYALTDLAAENHWTLGEDLALICSNDSIHYGDSGFDHAPFGTDQLAYLKTVAEDREISEGLLCGPVNRGKVRDFLSCCVDPDDVTRYRKTWCGRFAVSLGLNVASRMVGDLEERTLEGYLLDYGTSISEESLDVTNLDGMGPTAPNNFHHFVGYTSVGYL